MPRVLVAGNWKMNLNQTDAVRLAEGVVAQAETAGEVDLAVCPPYVYLGAVADTVRGSPVALGAQNMYHEARGAFTGEISAEMLVDIGCTYVILGHSERRHVLGETDQDVNRKLHSALASGLMPIVCVGELLEEREAGKTTEVVRRQIEGSLAGLTKDQMGRTVIAYEPVWAIGTGKVATPDTAQQVHADLRKMIQEHYNTDVARGVQILYGGSVKPENATDLLNRPDVDGALVGGASLKVESFIGIAACGRSA
jgi:triosephosphate isomerase